MATTAEPLANRLLIIGFHLFIGGTDLTLRYRPYKLKMKV